MDITSLLIITSKSFSLFFLLDYFFIFRTQQTFKRNVVELDIYEFIYILFNHGTNFYFVKN
jgi:hypothetical protein